MTKKTENKGIRAKDMGLKDLKELAVQLKLFTVEEVSTLKKPAILKVVTAWEKKTIEERKDGKTGLKTLGETTGAGVVPSVENKIDTHNGKKVISRTKREINGKTYEDILVETGETFTNPISL